MKGLAAIGAAAFIAMAGVLWFMTRAAAGRDGRQTATGEPGSADVQAGAVGFLNADRRTSFIALANTVGAIYRPTGRAENSHYLSTRSPGLLTEAICILEFEQNGPP